MDATKLLFCPFCGGPARIEKARFMFWVDYQVECMMCGCHVGVTSDTQQEAAVVWNTRKVISNEQERNV